MFCVGMVVSVLRTHATKMQRATRKVSISRWPGAKDAADGVVAAADMVLAIWILRLPTMVTLDRFVVRFRPPDLPLESL